jgi:hypothetical protein
MMDTSVKRIAVVQGAPSAAIQELFRTLVDRWRPTMRIAGVIAEDHNLPDRKCRAGYLRSIVSGTRYPIFQDLGPGAEACHLEQEGALAAAAAVEKDIVAGCDLVLLSKFGKLEAAGQGLIEAFIAALAADLPLLTSVSPAFKTAWTEFAAPLFEILPAEAEPIETWCRAVQSETAAHDH